MEGPNRPSDCTYLKLRVRMITSKQQENEMKFSSETVTEQGGNQAYDPKSLLERGKGATEIPIVRYIARINEMEREGKAKIAEEEASRQSRAKKRRR